ncbi:hypothetical protein ACSSUR_25020 [Pseudomonas cedrina]|uniref:hypothetical protein n=1 Tax=Pseudomonas cedrina TaxID=651740 RepID=UPI003ED98CA1
MDSVFRVEPGAEAVVGHCGSCGHETRTFRGFVFNHEDAYAVYLCTYTASHPEFGVAMVVSLRGWGDGADTTAKECVALEWENGDSGPGCRVIDASETSWVSNSILGQMLSREQAMASGRASEAFSVTDAVWAGDERLSLALKETQADFSRREGPGGV